MVKQHAIRLLRKIARIAAEEFVGAMKDATTSAATASSTAAGFAAPMMRLDVVNALAQLRSGEAKVQLNAFFAANHRWVAMLAERNRRTAQATYDFIDSTMPDAMFLLDQFKVVESRRDAINELDGEVLDLGVYKGSSTRALARIFPNKTIHGFDSFEGLPEDWSHTVKGDFGDVAGRLPDVPSNVRLYKGWFDDTLPSWARDHHGACISLLRVDCDIYSSTKTIFRELGPLVGSGTWVLFDELIGYRGWEAHEYKAFSEFLAERNLTPEYIAHGLTYVLVRLAEPSQA